MNIVNSFTLSKINIMNVNMSLIDANMTFNGIALPKYFGADS